MSTLDTSPQANHVVNAISTAPAAAKALPALADGRKGAGAAEADGYAEFADFERLRASAYAGQKRDQDRRYARFDERLTLEISHVRADLSARLDTLERHLAGEITALGELLQQEISDRHAAGKALSDAAHGARAELARDLDGIRQATAKGERAWRGALLEAQKQLSSELNRLHDRMTAALAAEVDALDSGKVSRASLAALLSETALQLQKDPASTGSMLEM